MMAIRGRGAAPENRMGRLLIAVSVLGVTLTSHGCKKPPPPPAVPSSEYIKPEAPVLFPTASGTHEHRLVFTDITASSGIEFTHVTGAFGKKWMPETMGGGAAFFDYDEDELPDILLVNSCYWPGHEPEGPAPTGRLYRNRGEGRFEDVTEASGFAEVSCYGMGAVIADYDGDGDNDIFITAVGRNTLLRNDAGRYVDVTDAAGVGFSRCDGKASAWEWSTGAVWVDYDRDGDLDLFVANYVKWTPETDLWTSLDGTTKTYATPQQYEGATCVLFRNNLDGTFTDVTKEAGVFNSNGKSLSVVADDFNDDGWPDLVVTNDTQPNFLYMNNTDGTFTDRALSAGIAYDENGLARAGMGVSVTDLTNSGQRCIAIGNFSGEPMSLYTQAGVDTFIDRAGGMRLTRPTTTSLTFGALFADFNLDGYDDLITSNGHIEPEIARIREGWTFAQPVQLFLNNRAGRFVEITDESGSGLSSPMVGRALATADIDGDGDLDVLVAANGGSPRLLRNDQVGDVHVVRVHLIGRAPNLAAIGSRLRADYSGMTVTRFVSTGGSYLSQSEHTATFGLGDASSIEKLEVRWPDGASDQFEDLSADAMNGVTYTIEQGKGIIGTNRFRTYFDGAILKNSEMTPGLLNNRTVIVRPRLDPDPE